MNPTPFAERKQAYEQAMHSFNDWFLSEPRCSGDFQDSVIGDISRLATIEEHRQSLLAAPAETLDDILYKVELSIGEIDDVAVGADSDLALLKRTLVAIRAGSLVLATQVLQKALQGELDYDFNAFAYEGAAAALADLRRLSS